MVGLVLDRTGGKFTAKVDGTDAIVELTAEEDRTSNALRGHYLTTPQNTHLLYLSTSGALIYYKGRDEFPLVRDHSVPALAAATNAGPPKKEKAAYQILDEQLDAISVVKKLPAFTAVDASNPAKIAAAFEQADPSMVVHYTLRDPNGWVPKPQWTPSNVSGTSFGGGSWQTDEAWDQTKKGLAGYGGVVKGYSEPDSVGNHLFVQSMKGYPAPLANRTPGLIWEMDGTTAIFLAFDGGRYRLDVSSSTVEKGAPLEMGGGDASSWPPPLQHSLLGIPEITALVKAGALPQKNADDVLAADDDWNKCAQKTWAGAKPEADKLRTTDMDASTRQNRMQALHDKWADSVRAKCKGSADKLERTVTQIIGARDKERLALYEKAKAKFGK